MIGAGTERLRPILMTAFAAIGALLPLALGFGTGSEMERPLAIAVIGGLVTSTAFTLVMIPVLYASVAGGFRPVALAAGPGLLRGPRSVRTDLIARGLAAARRWRPSSSASSRSSRRPRRSMSPSTIPKDRPRISPRTGSRPTTAPASAMSPPMKSSNTS